jgi:hypothetical protein
MDSILLPGHHIMLMHGISGIYQKSISPYFLAFCACFSARSASCPVKKQKMNDPGKTKWLLQNTEAIS